MVSALKGLLVSKKFWLTVVGSAVISVMSHFGVAESVIQLVAGLFGLNVLGQGLADVGKSKLPPAA